MVGAPVLPPSTSPRRLLMNAVNGALHPLNLRIEQVRPSEWDKTFKEWINAAQAAGVDPNDLGDMEWETDLLSEALEKHYLPLLKPHYRP